MLCVVKSSVDKNESSQDEEHTEDQVKSSKESKNEDDGKDK